jgi:hypothetical protein
MMNSLSIPMADLETVTVQDGVIDDITDKIVQEMLRDAANQKKCLLSNVAEKWHCTAVH